MDRSELIAVAGELFEEHGLDARPWRLEFGNYGHRLGWCCSRRQVIGLDDYYANQNSEPNVLDTLLHEIAHALVGTIHGHDPIWKAMAVKLGCTPKACGKIGVIVRPGKWQATCPTCTRPFHKYRIPRLTVGYYCPSCGEEKGQLAFTAQISGG